MEQAREGISKITGLLERWDIVCSKVKIAGRGRYDTWE